MRRFLTRILTAFSVVFIITLLSSCNRKVTRFFLTEHLKYYEAPADYTISDIQEHIYDFKPMNKTQRENFSLVMNNKKNYIWLKIDFVVPEKLKDQDIAFYIPQLHSASRLYLNGEFLKQYGEFPPNERGAGFQTQLYSFPKENLSPDGENIILIQCWTGIFGALYGEISIGPYAETQILAERINFHNSRITLIFATVLLLMFFIYIFMYYVMKRFHTNKEYLYYALTLFYTVHFLVPFFLPEIAWIKPENFSYLWILKIFGGIGAMTTIYFANTFILTYINFKATFKNTAPRFLLYLISAIGMLSIPSYQDFNRYLFIFGSICMSQFAITITMLIKAFFNKTNRRHAGLLLLGFSPVIITVSLDTIVRVVFDRKSAPYSTLYGWQFTILIFLVYLLVRFSKMYTHNTELSNQLEDINAHLEDLVALRTKELSDANYNLSQGLETVSHVQHNFLPLQSRSFKGWDLAVYYKALDHEVSGDLYDYYYTNGNLDGVGLFDVSGHGISAGLMTILAKGIISQQFKSGILNEEPLSSILMDINKNYIKEKVNVENYITGVLFHFEDFNQNDICSVELANAGHPYPLFYNAEQDSILELKHSDSTKQFGFIGIDGMEVSFPSIYFTAQKNDIIICFTDGLTESMNSHREEFSKDRLISIIKENKNKSADEIVHIIKEQLDKFIGSNEIDDDISYIVLKRTDSADYIEEI